MSGGERDLRRINRSAKEKPYDRQINIRRGTEECAVQLTRRPEAGHASQWSAAIRNPGWTETRIASQWGAYGSAE